MASIQDHLIAFVEQYGLLAMFASVTLETLGLPLPGESAVIAAASAAGAGKLKLWHVVITAIIAAVLGDNIGYWIGRRYGRSFVTTYGTRIGITESRYARVEKIAGTYGPAMVIAARFVVLLRQLNGLVAGTTGMHWVQFFMANVVGATLWVGVWVTLAYKLGREILRRPNIWHDLSYVAMVLVPLLIVGLIVQSHLGHQKRDTAQSENPPES